jgi:gluconolactonase
VPQIESGVTRRSFVGGVAAAVSAPAAAQFVPTQRLPDPAVRILDPSFTKYRVTLASVEQLFTGCRWAEGPVWFGDQRTLIWSDVSNNRLLRWSEVTGEVDAFRAPSGYSNGNTRDHQGRLVTCEQLDRRITRTEYDGSITVLADQFEGKRLNSPNDITVGPDGAIWFSDHNSGIASDYEGVIAKQELPTQVYRIDPETRAISLGAAGMDRPNGLAFGPGGKALYIIESGSAPRRIWAYTVLDGGRRLGERKLLISCPDDATADGLRIDQDGNLWVGWGMGTPDLDGVRVFNPAGTAIGHIGLPERCANLAFGGAHRNRLFMAASRSIYALYVNTRGL